MKLNTKSTQILGSQKNYLSIFVLILALVLTSCSSTSTNNHHSLKSCADSIPFLETNASLDSVILFLLDASAKDFIEHQPPIPLGFRNVQFKNILGKNAENSYILCGQFLNLDKENQDEWTFFATIKTSGYEQWIGNQSLVFCNDSKAITYKTPDLSVALKNRVDSLNHNQYLSK